MDIFKGLLVLAAFIILILLILLLVYKSRNADLQNERNSYKERLRESAPYKIGQTFHTDEDNIPDEVVVSLSAQLVPVHESSSSKVKLMSVLDRFFDDPAKMFDEFYNPVPFGVVLPISRITPSSTRKDNSYFIVVRDLAGREYYLLMEGLPEYMTYKFKVVGSK